MLIPRIAALLVALMGAVVLLFGYREFRIMLHIWGFFAGFWSGALVMTALFGDGFLATTTGWVVGFIASLVFAVLSYLFYTLAIAILAAVLGADLMVLFSLLALPVELDASRRALKMLDESGLMVSKADRQGSRAVLRAAALTYLAAAVTSIQQLLYYISIARRQGCSNMPSRLGVLGVQNTPNTPKLQSHYLS